MGCNWQVNEKGTLSCLMKELLPELCCRWKLRPSGRLHITQGRARDLHKSLILQWHPFSGLWYSSPPAAWGPEAALALSPLLAQTDRHRHTEGRSQLHMLQRSQKAALGAGDRSWDREVEPHQRFSDTLVALARSSSRGALVPSKGHREAKVSVPFLHPSSPHLQRGSTTVQLKSTWGSRAQSYVLSFPLGQSSLFKRKYGSTMTGKARGVWVTPGQWWFCSSFHAFWLYVPPSLLGWEFQVPVIHYWRTQSEGQTNSLFDYFF